MGSPPDGAGGVGGGDNGGRGSDEDSKPDKSEFDRSVEDNSNRPDRAPAAAAPDSTTAPDDDDDDAKSTDNADRPDRAAGPPGIGAPPSTPANDHEQQRASGPPGVGAPPSTLATNDLQQRAAGPPGIGAPSRQDELANIAMEEAIAGRYGPVPPEAEALRNPQQASVVPAGAGATAAGVAATSLLDDAAKFGLKTAVKALGPIGVVIDVLTPTPVADGTLGPSNPVLNENTNEIPEDAKPGPTEGTPEAAEGEKPSDDITVGGKIEGQAGRRGWTDDDIADTVDKPEATSKAKNKATGNDATAYFDKNGDYVVVDDDTRDVVQISDRNDPNWVPDDSIEDPYKPDQGK